MAFSPDSYGPVASAFLNGSRNCTDLSLLTPSGLFPNARFPRESLSGLWLFFDDLDRSHTISQDLSTPEASFWHGIMHRRQPDPSNAAYWFRRTGRHSVFPALREAAAAVGYDAGSEWDPFAWIDFWERARRQPGSAEYRVALAVQRVEWEILFDHCARPGK